MIKSLGGGRAHYNKHFLHSKKSSLSIYLFENTRSVRTFQNSHFVR